MNITVDDIMSWGPCYSRERVAQLFCGREAMTPLEIAEAEHVSIDDRFWVLLRSEVIPEMRLHELGCQFTERCLPVWEAAYPNDARPREGIATKRRWIRGETTADELAAAKAAARSAASRPSASLSASLSAWWLAWAAVKAAEAAWATTWAETWAARAASWSAWEAVKAADAAEAVKAMKATARSEARGAAEKRWQLEQVVKVLYEEATE